MTSWRGVRPNPTTTSQRVRATKRGATSAKLKRRAIRPARTTGTRCAVTPVGGRSVVAVYLKKEWPRSARPLAIRRRSASVPPPVRLRCMNAICIGRRSAPRAEPQPEGLQPVAQVERAKLARLLERQPGAQWIAGLQARASQTLIPACLAAHELGASEDGKHLGLRRDELVRDPDRLLPNGGAVAREAARVAPVAEDRLVDEHGREPGRYAQHEIQIVEDAKARIEGTDRLERVARE